MDTKIEHKDEDEGEATHRTDLQVHQYIFSFILIRIKQLY